MSITVRAVPPRISWGLFRPVDSIPGADEDAQIAPVASGLDNIQPQRTKDGQFRLPNLTITVGLDSSNTLVVRTADKTPELLSHEQRHYDLLILVSRALARDLEAISAPSVQELATQLQTAKDAHDANAQAIDKAYDTQTDHSRNKQAQAKWDAAIAKALDDPNASQVLSMPL